MSRTYTWTVLLFVTTVFLAGCSTGAQEKRVLVFTKTAGYTHPSIEDGTEAIASLGSTNGFDVVVTRDSTMFNDDTLRTYSAVVFLSTTGNVLGPGEQLSLKRFIQSGGGFVGIHAASDTEYQWPWYGQLVGGYFTGHPANPGVLSTALQVDDAQHISTQHLGGTWERQDEWYDIRYVNPATNTLLSIDETTYKTEDENPEQGFRPIAWYHEFDGGRSFYTALGHTPESYSEQAFLDHILGGIQYAIGDNDVKDYSSSDVVPPEKHFTHDVLAANLTEPMEIDLLPNGNLILVERRGAVKIFDQKSSRLRTMTRLDVYHGLEQGLLGVAVDPDAERNHWIYMAYTPPDSINPRIHLSRFTASDDWSDIDSEQVLLTIPVDRGEACCHLGGSVEFDGDGNLYLTVGDNTNPFASAGTSPVDEMDGRAFWDAQRTAANTNDLRGKILRIKPTADGYEIPEGNLFEQTDSTRAEIYVMGNRNPFRLSIDNREGAIYWGEVGPDAHDVVPERGPRGYDEINRATAAGNYGWPYMIGDNKAYNDFDFERGRSGPVQEISAIANMSPNNTGRRYLPESQPALIWYPYGPSDDFPQVGEGGRTAMAGPVYYESDFENRRTRFPSYYDSKLFIYEWMRHWISVVTLDEEGNYVDMEPFLPTVLSLSRPMDMFFAPDGSLYMIEYGGNWKQQNEDARLSRITYKP